MALRSERRRLAHPYPVVFGACLAALPTHGFRLRRHDEKRGLIEADRGWSRWSMGEVVTLHLGADDATSTSVVIDSSLRAFGSVRAHHRNFEQVFTALDRYLSYYYGRI